MPTTSSDGDVIKHASVPTAEGLYCVLPRPTTKKSLDQVYSVLRYEGCDSGVLHLCDTLDNQCTQDRPAITVHKLKESSEMSVFTTCVAYSQPSTYSVNWFSTTSIYTGVGGAYCRWSLVGDVLLHLCTCLSDMAGPPKGCLGTHRRAAASIQPTPSTGLFR